MRRRDPVESDRTARRKAELLDDFIRYLLRRGVSDISLRPAAPALGTSPRMLIYCFGSRRRLLFAAVVEIRLRERVRFTEEIRRRPPGGSVRDRPRIDQAVSEVAKRLERDLNARATRTNAS
jgi:AcrR family transcriptional regulator